MGEPDLLALLLGFTLAKMAIAGGIVWLGLRSPERPFDGDGGEGPGADGAPPLPGPRGARAERRRRGGASRRRRDQAGFRARAGDPGRERR